ncbi:uncharacterized protein DSM5745_04478 [Aspergillus mulundensis]|uniref:Uncharacterized protein n=1 Tax=Aspergillus mulundensis TaxID=1810919 RepID=A0A3D8SCT1_9EURO|nr:hypothetical protein DSM5745_04478 [Aspergillus mulundensis]RDW84152.1 hypothetical protein DSM5745_04478 [Aspergillus mulundensis]
MMFNLWLVDWVKFCIQHCPGGERVWPRSEEVEGRREQPEHQAIVAGSDKSRTSATDNRGLVKDINERLDELQRLLNITCEMDARTRRLEQVARRLTKIQRREDAHARGLDEALKQVTELRRREDTRSRRLDEALKQLAEYCPELRKEPATCCSSVACDEVETNSFRPPYPSSTTILTNAASATGHVPENSRPPCRHRQSWVADSLAGLASARHHSAQ